jgi:hypothetical protein
MQRMMVVLAVAIACGLPERASFAQAPSTDASLKQVFDDWKDRQALLKSVRYVVTGTMEYKDQVLPPGNPARPKRCVLLLDLERKRIRLETTEEGILEWPDGKRRWVPRASTQAWDGESDQTLVPREVNPDPNSPDLRIGIGRVQKVNQNSIDYSLLPVFFAHGIVPSIHAALRSSDMPVAYDPDDFELRGRQHFKGRNCLVVRTEALPLNQPAFDEYLVDRDRQSAIYRHVMFTGPNPSVRTDVEWKRTAFGWWADKWTHTWTLNGRLWSVHHLHVESFEPNPVIRDSDFKLPALPGMIVSVSERPGPETGLDPHYPARTTYRVTDSGSWEELSATGFTTKDGRVLPPERHRIWIWIALGIGIGALALGCYLFRRRRKAAPA